MNATINRNGNAEDGRMIIELIKDGDRFRWYGDGIDTEVSGCNVEDAKVQAGLAWGAFEWDLEFDDC